MRRTHSPYRPTVVVVTNPHTFSNPSVLSSSRMEDRTNVLARLKTHAAAHRERSLPRNASATGNLNGEESHIGTGGEGSSNDLFNETLTLGQGQTQAGRQDWT